MEGVVEGVVGVVEGGWKVCGCGRDGFGRVEVSCRQDSL